MTSSTTNANYCAKTNVTWPYLPQSLPFKGIGIALFLSALVLCSYLCITIGSLETPTHRGIDPLQTASALPKMTSMLFISLNGTLSDPKFLSEQRNMGA